MEEVHSKVPRLNNTWNIMKKKMETTKKISSPPCSDTNLYIFLIYDKSCIIKMRHTSLFHLHETFACSV